MSETGRNIIIILYQYSVVVKGIERKLGDAGYNVEILENFELIPNRVDRTDLFITYLPDDIMDNRIKRESLNRICELMDASYGKMIMIGESKFVGDLISTIPALKNYTWLERQNLPKNTWSYEKCYELAKNCKTPGELGKLSHSAYTAARRNNWFPDYTWFEKEIIIKRKG